MSARRKPENLPALTGARFFAASAVVVCHYEGGAVSSSVPLLGALFTAGPTAVSFFYVLSGAVLTWGCTQAQGLPAWPPQTFWAQRAARILPAYLLALALSLLPFVMNVSAMHPGSAGVFRCIAAFLAALFAVQAFIPPLTAGLNTPGWSISCEAFFYALWPRLVVALRSDTPGFPWRRCLPLALAAVLLPLAGIGALAVDVVPHGPFATVLDDVSGGEMLQRFLTYFPPLRVPEFAMGIVLGHALRSTAATQRSTGSETARELGLVVVIAGLSCALGSGLPSEITGVEMATRIGVESGILALLFAAFVWQLARGRGLLYRFLSRRELMLLGEASYALYVLQEPVFVWFTSAAKRIMPWLMDRWEYGFFVYAALLTATSLLVHRFVETPLRLRLTSMWLARTQPGTTAGA